ncbi:DEAD/DEAH box helicase [Limosilactobacillus sp.]|uniref:DEAD/DEAH box helicase n=1 Tax=Limosilactobacillus sp. TaxID=2773925 RepID=UPI0025BCFF67|nr:helicase-related protein [Limosilactobacillus sp.]MCH3922166.1 DEAD/DEAH box helicase family protein [Limosilactobacillus sp.]MCH3928937.1 DEAD/DEAH box helicase family protein [Limosilactobacillus sp.]
MKLTEYYGRRVIIDRPEWQGKRPPAPVQVLETIELGRHEIYCQRCGQRTAKKVAALPNGEFYCPRCINLGRVATLNKFYHVPEPNQFVVKEPVLTWQGHLSPLQQGAAKRVASGMRNHQHQLLWAVTGAGKTEMMFQGIAAALRRGERLAVASPRVDVCLELYPRLQAAFANTTMVLLHGRQELPYRYAQLTVCTTHQLLRFYRAFDNLIIDEVDAFPYAANAALLYVTGQAVKKTGGCLYLTATPGPSLLRQVRRKELMVSYLPLRYHGHLLPEIRLRLTPRWRRELGQKRLPASLVAELRRTLAAGHRFLFFVPHVRDLPGIATALEEAGFERRIFTTVHAADPERLEKVQGMRDGRYDFLVTTTIMERGVTFPEIDVFVLGADDPVFSSSALVQIAGRAGRASSRPEGKVVFWLGCPCRQVREAVRQIHFMNRKGQALQR